LNIEAVPRLFFYGGLVRPMLFGAYRISSVLLDDAILPTYKGSTFRGAFGGCLKRAVCAVKKSNCSDCLLFSRCIYAQLFEQKDWRDQGAGRTVAPPHPYMIEPDNDQRTRLRASDEFNFNLLLFGEINASLPYFVYAFELMGEQGIGKKTGEHRARFSLRHVRNQGIELFDPQKGRLEAPPRQETLLLPPLETSKETASVSITLNTPLRLKSDNHLQDRVEFPLLVRTMLRRVSSLFNAWGEGEPQLDYKGMIKRAEQIVVVDGHLYWHDWERYSNRQEQAMSFGGMLGSITYRGPLAEYLPLIRLCQRLHIGKQTTFGLGKFTAEFTK